MWPLGPCRDVIGDQLSDRWCSSERPPAPVAVGRGCRLLHGCVEVLTHTSWRHSSVLPCPVCHWTCDGKQLVALCNFPLHLVTLLTRCPCRHLGWWGRRLGVIGCSLRRPTCQPLGRTSGAQSAPAPAPAIAAPRPVHPGYHCDGGRQTAAIVTKRCKLAAGFSRMWTEKQPGQVLLLE